MADLRLKQEVPEMNQGTNTQNRWVISRTAPKRRKAIPQKRPLTNADTSSQLVTRRRRLAADDCQSSTGFSESLENGRGHLPGARQFRGGEKRGGNGGETVAKLRAELEYYKKENKELRQKLEAALNIKDLETTLRMTLQSFGVPVPDNSACHACTCDDDSESQEQVEYELQHMASANEEEDMAPDFEENIPTKAQYYYQRDSRVAEAASQDTSGFHPSSTSNATQENHNHSQVELIPGSNIFVDSNKLSSIAFKKGWSYTLLTRSLMPMVFTKEEMAASCVRGERATGKGALNSPARPALDQMRVQAIITFVSSQFPDIQPYQITQTMNQKLVDVRGTIQKRKQAARLAKRELY